MQMVLSPHNRIVVTNCHQAPVTSDQQPTMKFNHPIIIIINMKIKEALLC